jgi:steroid 5-alpha reductase family enzyme
MTTRADKQLLRFEKSEHAPEELLCAGLWSRSRHPNYLGGMGFWWGLYLFGVAASPDYWWTGVGALSITLLFRIISLRLIDDRMLERRPGFAEYMTTTPAFIPSFPRRTRVRKSFR